jgi:hypothetical protein
MSYTNYNTSFLRNKLIIPVGARMDSLGGPSLWTPTAVQNHGLGRILEFDDGTNRAWKYCENGATAIAKSLMVAAEAVDAQTKDTLQTDYTQDVGDTVINILATTGNGINDGDLINSYMFLNQGATIAQGDYYLINNNKWITGDTVLQITLADQGGIRHAIVATDNISIVKNKYKDVVVKPLNLLDVMIGVTMELVPIDYFFWAQFRGPACCLVATSGTIVAGEPLGHIDGTTDAGAVGVVATHASDFVVGHVFCYAAGDDYCMVDLTGLG